MPISKAPDQKAQEAKVIKKAEADAQLGFEIRKNAVKGEKPISPLPRGEKVLGWENLRS